MWQACGDWLLKCACGGLHLLVDADIVDDAAMVASAPAEVDRALASFGGDGAYDKCKVYEAVQAHTSAALIKIPPRKDACIWQHGNPKGSPFLRDENLRTIGKMGCKKWKRVWGYHRCFLAETAVCRVKTLFGDHLTTCLFETQITQALNRCKIVNRSTHLGRPESFLVE